MSEIKDFPRLYPPDIQLKISELIHAVYPDYTIPVDIEEIVEALGLEIVPEPGLKKDYGIDAGITSDFEAILVDAQSYNSEAYLNRVRFSLAHELGHFVLHRDFYQKNTRHSKDSFEDFLFSLSDYQYRIIEHQANVFAGRLLVPDDKIIDIAVTGRREIAESSRVFQVSEKVILRRFEEINNNS